MTNFEHAPREEHDNEKPRYVCADCKQEVSVGHAAEVTSGALIAKDHLDTTGKFCMGTRQPVIKTDRREKEQ